MAKRGILEHPKTIELASRLELPECYALGILEAFWHHVARYFPEGEITGLKPSVLARSIRYPGDAAGLWALLSECGFLDIGADGRAIVHDWSEHADNAVHQLLKKRGTRFADGRAPFSRAVPVDAPSSQTVCEPFTNELPQNTTHSCEIVNGSCLPEPKPEPKPEPGTESADALGAPPTNGAAPEVAKVKRAPTTEQRVAMAAGVCVEHYRHEFQRLHPGLSPPLVDNAGKNVLKTKLRAICNADNREIGAAEDECKRLLTRFLGDDHPKASESLWDLRVFSWRANALRGEGASNGGSGSRREQDDADASKRAERWERLNRESVQQRWGGDSPPGKDVP